MWVESLGEKKKGKGGRNLFKGERERYVYICVCGRERKGEGKRKRGARHISLRSTREIKERGIIEREAGSSWINEVCHE